MSHTPPTTWPEFCLILNIFYKHQLTHTSQILQRLHQHHYFLYIIPSSLNSIKLRFTAENFEKANQFVNDLLYGLMISQNDCNENKEIQGYTLNEL